MDLKMKNFAMVLAGIVVTGCIHEGSLSSAPKAASFSVITDEDVEIILDLPVTDRENNIIEFYLEEPPVNGVVEGVYPDLVYRPNSNYYGTDEFRYIVTDGVYDSNVAIASITINPVNDPPVITGSPINTLKAFEEYKFSPIVSDLENDALSFSINNLPGWANFDESSGILKGIPTNSDINIYENVTISVSDGLETTSLAAFSITVVVNPWETKMPLNVGRHGASAGLIDNKIYVVGGFNAGYLSNVELYNSAENTWSDGTVVPTARWSHTSNVLNGKLYVLGGESGIVLPTVEEYDPVNDLWATKTSMPTSRSTHASCIANNKIYVFGGFTDTSHSTITDSVEEYDPLTDTWTTKSAMSGKRWGMVCTNVDGKIYLFGGADVSTLVEIYDPLLDAWSTGPSMLKIFRHGAAIGSVGGRVYIIGGHDSQSTVQEFDSQTNTWSLKSPMPVGRYGMTVVTLGDTIYAIGGRNSSSNNLPTVESYSPLQD